MLLGPGRVLLLCARALVCEGLLTRVPAPLPPLPPPPKNTLCYCAGIVILQFDTQMEPAVARDMIKGAADPLMSAFSLRYSQLLQLARTEGSSAEMMLRVSAVLVGHCCPGCTACKQ